MLKLKLIFIISLLLLTCKNQNDYVVINQCHSGNILKVMEKEITKNIIKFEKETNQNNLKKYKIRCSLDNLIFDVLYKKTENIFIYKNNEYYLIILKNKSSKIKHFVLKKADIKFLGYSFEKNEIFYLNKNKKYSIRFKENYIYSTNFEF